MRVRQEGNFQNTIGEMFHGRDDETSWERMEIGHEIGCTLSARSIDQYLLGQSACTSENGQGFTIVGSGGGRLLFLACTASFTP